MFKKHKWSVSRFKPNKRPTCLNCGQGAAAWINQDGKFVTFGGTLGSVNKSENGSMTFWCPK